MNVITNWKTTLSASVTATQSTLPITSIQTTDDTPHTITISDFDDGFGYMVIEPSGTKIEIIKFTGITDNGDGSGILTGVTRGLAFYGSTDTTVVANGRTHQSGSPIVCSDAHYYFEQLLDLAGDQTITGKKTFPNGANTPVLGSSYVAPTASNQVASKGYVDASATGTATYDQNVISGVAGETLVAGNLVYLKAADGRWWLTDADTLTTVDNAQIGFAQGSASAGGAVNIVINGIDKNQSGLTAGIVYYASNTAGALSSSTGTNTKIIGQALTTTSIIMNPYMSNPIAVTAMAAQAIQGGLGNIFTRTLAGNETFTQSGFTTGRTFLVEVTQGSGTAYTVTWFSGITWVIFGGAAPIQTTTSNGITTYGFRCTGTNTFLGYLVATQ